MVESAPGDPEGEMHRLSLKSTHGISLMASLLDLVFDEPISFLTKGSILNAYENQISQYSTE